ncbi:MAG: hypothetical protein H7Z18_05755 [Methylophilaceae bacterium]|nr:hypothetical protein [Methylophilaceae bacterium]
MPTPVLMDWVVISAYSSAAWLCLRAKVIASRLSNKKEAHFWWLIACLVLILGINKFLYFENCITYGLSNLAHSDGWYESRRTFQAEFIVLIIFLLTCLLLGILYALKNFQWALRSAAIAFVLLLFLVILRTVSLHQIDELIFPDILGIGIGINWIVELICNLWIGLSAFIYLKR